MYLQYDTINEDGLQMDIQYVQWMNTSVLVAMAMTGAGVVQLMPERDGGVHHWLEVSFRSLTMKRATYKCTIITITSTLTGEAEVLQATLSTQHSPRCLAWSCLSIIWCRQNSYVVALTHECNRWCPPCLVICIGYSAVSPGQTISASIAWQWHEDIPLDPQDSQAPHILICAVFQVGEA